MSQPVTPLVVSTDSNKYRIVDHTTATALPIAAKPIKDKEPLTQKGVEDGTTTPANSKSNNEAYNMLHDGSFKSTQKVLDQEKYDYTIKPDATITGNKANIDSNAELIEDDATKTEDKKLMSKSSIISENLRPDHNSALGFNHVVTVVFGSLVVILGLFYFVYKWKKNHM